MENGVKQIDAELATDTAGMLVLVMGAVLVLIGIHRQKMPDQTRSREVYASVEKRGEDGTIRGKGCFVQKTHELVQVSDKGLRLGEKASHPVTTCCTSRVAAGGFDRF